MPIFYPEVYNLMHGEVKKRQRYQLSDLTYSDYGKVNLNGVYNVEDWAHVSMNWANPVAKIDLVADWRSMSGTDVSLTIDYRTIFELGLCPEDAYASMIQTAIKNCDNDLFWAEQLKQDIWIHSMMDVLDASTPLTD
jgi:hypothetical protein